MLHTLTVCEYPQNMKNKTSGRLDSWQEQEMFLFFKKKKKEKKK